MSKYTSQPIDTSDQDELRTRIAEAFVDALSQATDRYKSHLAKEFSITVPASIRIDVAIQNMDIVVILTEEYHESE